jgi:hypothetical protein
VPPLRLFNRNKFREGDKGKKEEEKNKHLRKDVRRFEEKNITAI